MKMPGQNIQIEFYHQKSNEQLRFVSDNHSHRFPAKSVFFFICWTCYIKEFQLPALYLDLEEQMNFLFQRIPQEHAENRETHSKLN